MSRYRFPWRIRVVRLWNRLRGRAMPYRDVWDGPNVCPDCLSFLGSGDGHNDGCPRLAA